MTDKTPLDDNRLDLSADHVHPITLTKQEFDSLYDTSDLGGNFDEIVAALLDYMDAEGKDAILVITVKRD